MRIKQPQIHAITEILHYVLTLSLLDPSQRRVYKPSRRTRPFAATGYELANLAAEASAI